MLWVYTGPQGLNPVIPTPFGLASCSNCHHHGEKVTCRFLSNNTDTDVRILEQLFCLNLFEPLFVHLAGMPVTQLTDMGFLHGPAATEMCVASGPHVPAGPIQTCCHGKAQQSHGSKSFQSPGCIAPNPQPARSTVPLGLGLTTYKAVYGFYGGC